MEGEDYTIENGIIAQSIKDIPDLKHVVKGDEEQGILSVDYNSIHCTHIAATRELHQKVKTLEQTILLLQQEIENLKAKS